MAKINIVLFDVDGTILNTPEVVLKSYDHVSRIHDLPLHSREAILEHMGGSIQQIIEALYPGEDLDKIKKTKEDFLMENSHQVSVYAGLLDTLESLQTQGKKLAAVTGATAAVYNLLKAHNIGNFFQYVVHSEMLTNQKPDPEGIMKVLNECGEKPENAIMIGDMTQDVQAGKNAGVTATIGLTHGFGTREELEETGADFVIDSFQELLPILKTIEDGS